MIRVCSAPSGDRRTTMPQRPSGAGSQLDQQLQRVAADIRYNHLLAGRHVDRCACACARSRSAASSGAGCMQTCPSAPSVRTRGSDITPDQPLASCASTLRPSCTQPKHDPAALGVGERLRRVEMLVAVVEFVLDIRDRAGGPDSSRPRPRCSAAAHGPTPRRSARAGPQARRSRDIPTSSRSRSA